MSLRHLSAIVLLICSLSPARQPQAPTGPSPKRPRIGLVLSGGGARGTAHIGVLKELERLHIPIDAIVGTSVGSLVGGLYASGMSPDEIESTVTSIDWERLFEDAPERNNLSYRRKQDNGKYVPNLELGIRNGHFMMPTGLSAGRKVSFLLQRLLLRNGGVRNFDRLRIPFRAVATDLATGAMVVLKSGNLADALRASMSVPGALAPFELDGHLLVDGGLVRNLPVDVMKQEMDVDVIIAVNVAKGLFPRERLNSALAVSQQMITIMLLKDEKEQTALLTDRDVYIKPALGDMAASDFAHVRDVIPVGAEATRAHASELARYSVPETRWQAYLASQRGALVTRRTVDFVNVDDATRLDPQVLMARIKTRPGRPLDLHTLQRDLDRIYQIGSYESVGFEWIRDRHGEGILIRTRPKPWGRQFLQFGVRLSDDLEGNSRFDLRLAHTMTEVNRLGGEWKNEIQLGRTRRIRTEFFQPLDYAGRWAVLPYLEYTSDIREWYRSDHWNRFRFRELASGLLAGRQLGNWGAAMVGIVRSSGSITNFNIFDDVPLSPEQTVDMGGYLFRFDYDQLNDPYFPTRGSSGHVHWFRSNTAFGADLDYHKLDVALKSVFTWDDHTIILFGEVGDSLGSQLPIYDTFRLGGMFRLSGYREGRLIGNYKLLLGSTWYQKLPVRLFGFKFYAGASLEAGHTWMTRNDRRWRDMNWSGSVFVGSLTMVGAVYVGYGRADDGSSMFYFTLGQVF